MRKSRVTGDGLTLAVTERGEAASPTIVLVHGYPDTQAMWNLVADRLAERFHVVTYDVRGAGESEAPKRASGYAMAHLGADLRAVADAVSPGHPVHVVGHDWGSIQSWPAICGPALAGRVASFTSISGPCLDHVGTWMRDRVKADPVAARELVSQAVRSWYIGAFHVPFLPPRVWTAGIGRAMPALLRHGEGAIVDEAWPAPTIAADAARGVELYRRNVRPALLDPGEVRTDVPVQLIVPRQDRFVSTAMLADVQRWAPHLYRREVAAGHWVPRSKPDHVAAWVGELVDHVEGGPEALSLKRCRAGTEARRVVVVTGAGSGIGRQSAFAFAEKGDTVVVADVDEAAGERTAELCRLLGGTAEAFAVDVSDSEAMEHFAKAVAAELGVPDVVVNNAGIGMAGPALRTSVEDWERVLGVNLWGVIHGIRLFGAQMAERGTGGAIVNVASAAAFMPSVSYPAYATSKAAVLMLSECLGAELAADSITVSAICPGVIDTNITRTTRFVGTDSVEQTDRRAALAALYRRRKFTPDRVAAAIVEASRSGAPVVPVSPEAHVMRFASRVLPGLIRRIARLDLSARG